MDLPCGQCIGCRLEHSRQWAVRGMHEASLYADNCMLTLTYRPEDMPVSGTLVKSDFQLFMKRLRERLSPRKIRVLYCGEYGERTFRPHYHAIVFGWDPADKVFFKAAVDGSPLYTSQFLEDVWKLGFVTVGAVTFESVAYVARYVVKKAGYGKEGRFIHVDGVPGRTDVVTGEVVADVADEFMDMSRRPGIARAWFERFKNEVMQSDSVIVRGRECPVPRYYSKIIESAHSDIYSRICRSRRKRSKLYACDRTASRLAVRETCAKARAKLLVRSLDDGV